MNSRFPFSPYPSGWFRVGVSRDIKPGQIKPLRYFGRDLALFRAEDGAARVLEAHCPHLGAHLGHGGRVIGDSVQCPFHGWRWNGEGQCETIPYSQKIPPNAALRRWPVKEINGLVMVYHDEQGAEPAWEPPEMPEYHDPAWLPFRFAGRYKIRTHVQEIAENGMDMAHFPFLHHQQTASAESQGVEISGPFLTHHVFQHYNVFGVLKRFSSDVTGPLDIYLYGLGYFVNRAVVRTKVEMRYAFAFFFTPIDEEHIEGYSILSMEKTLGNLLTRLLRSKAIKEGVRTIGQDIPIWENKLYRQQPKLCEGDGPIMAYRRWARQFYPAQANASWT